MRLTKRALGIEPSATLAVDSRAKALAAAGKDIVNFGVGEPDFPTPPAATEAATEAIREGFTKYTPAAGIPQLRKAIREKLLRDNGLDYDPEEIVVSVGAKHSLYNAFQVLCEVGDEVLVPSPYWVTYPEQVRLAGGVPVFVKTDKPAGYKLDVAALKAHVTPRTRILILNSPSNPTGAVVPPSEMEAVAEFVLRHNLYLISDEVYEKLVYHGAVHRSPAAVDPEVKRRTVVINGVSKAYAMTGWRIGYAAAPLAVAKAMAAFQGHVTSNPTSIAQRAALGALTGDSEAVTAMVTEFEARRDYMVSRLEAIPGLRTPEPEGAFYVFPSLGGLAGARVAGRTLADGSDLAMILLEEAGVAVVPGVAFGKPDAVRFSYANSMANIEKGMDRVEEVLSKAS
ncbi:MAG: pyridoxal phosphate-dependent aminotransferase [Bacillota bacterium]|nr:MAG: pyridoxal phosphate-dependent aminotransferase [Bacillota bacterium]